MTGATIITKFNNMIDDVLDSDFAYQLLNDAKNEVEAMRLWEQLKKETTYTVSSGYSYTSALTALPTRFANDILLTEATNFSPYNKYSFEDLYAKKNAPYGYFIDLASGNLHLTGENHVATTVYFYYTQYSADLSSSSSWAFPERFHFILPLKMAELYYAVNAGEKGRSWDDRWSNQYERILNDMFAWDDNLKTRNRRPRNHSGGTNPKAVY
jgi:hypothetical protein